MTSSQEYKYVIIVNTNTCLCMLEHELIRSNTVFPFKPSASGRNDISGWASNADTSSVCTGTVKAIPGERPLDLWGCGRVSYSS